jgi:hypothetical protein
MYRPTGLGAVLRGWFGLMLLFQLARGWLEGAIQPVILSVQARAVGRHRQSAVMACARRGSGLARSCARVYSGVIPDDNELVLMRLLKR